MARAATRPPRRTTHPQAAAAATPPSAGPAAATPPWGAQRRLPGHQPAVRPTASRTPTTTAMTGTPAATPRTGPASPTLPRRSPSGTRFAATRPSPRPESGVARTGQQLRYDESEYVSYPGYDGVDDNGYGARRGYDDYDDYGPPVRRSTRSTRPAWTSRPLTMAPRAGTGRPCRATTLTAASTPASTGTRRDGLAGRRAPGRPRRRTEYRARGPSGTGPRRPPKGASPKPKRVGGTKIAVAALALVLVGAAGLRRVQVPDEAEGGRQHRGTRQAPAHRLGVGVGRHRAVRGAVRPVLPHTVTGSRPGAARARRPVPGGVLQRDRQGPVRPVRSS